MPDGTHGRCQGYLSKVMTRMQLLVGGLAFRTEAAALNDHRLAMVHQSIDHGVSAGLMQPASDGLPASTVRSDNNADCQRVG